MRAVTEAPASPRLGRTLEFMRVLWSLDHALQSRSKTMATTIGFTGPQRLVVRLVGRFPGIAAGPLATLMMIHPSTLTGILKRLEARGLLERQADPKDGRRVRLKLTGRALNLGRDTDETVEAAVRRTLGRVPESTVDSARALLEELTRQLLPGGGVVPLPRQGARSRRADGSTRSGLA